MRYDALSNWQKTLEQPNWAAPSISLLISAEPHVLELAWQAFLEALRRLPNWSAQALCMFDAETGEEAALFEELNTLPFLVPMKVIVIRRADKYPLPMRKQLDSLLNKRLECSTNTKGLPNPIHVVVMAAQWQKGSSLYATCQKSPEGQGAVLEVAVAKSYEREATWATWLQQRMQAHGKSLPFPLAKKWVHQLEDPSFLATECDKLLNFVGERTSITEADLEAMCLLVEPQSIWQLGEAICRGDLTKALIVMEFLLEGDISPFALLASLRHQLQTSCKVAELLEAKVSPTQLAAQLPQLHGKALDSQCRLAKEYGVEGFHRALCALTQLEFDLKDRAIDPKCLIQRLIFLLSKRTESMKIV